MRPLPDETRARWHMHACVALWGCTGILGKLITLSALALVFWRMWLVTCFVLLVPRVRRGLAALSPRLGLAWSGIGCLLALHWVTFYAAVKLANASVGATCMALAPIFLSVLGPLASRQRFDVRELLVSVLAVPGVALVVGSIPGGMQLGLALGILSAGCVAGVSVLNKRYVARADALVMTCVEMGAGAAAITLLLVASSGAEVFAVPSARDAALLAVLAIGCTLLPFALSLVALRKLSAFSAQLIVNLEPVYTIVLAIALLDEQRELDRSFYLGVALILIAIFAHALFRRDRDPSAGKTPAARPPL